MRRALRFVFELVQWSLWLTVPAHAGPVAAAVGIFVGWLGGGGALAGIVGGVLKLGLGLGLSYLAQALLGPKAAAPVGGTSGKLSFGGAVPRTFMLGRGMTAGSLVYANTWGGTDDTPNQFLTMVIALADMPVAGLAELWVNGTKVTYDPSGGDSDDRGLVIPEYTKDGKWHLWIRFYDGTQTAADPLMVGQFSGDDDRPYESTRIGTGIAYAVMTARVNAKLWTSEPSYKFVLDGIPLYDIREDQSLGGAQLWTDPTTWTGSGNPMVQAYNILRGIRYAGKWFYGAQTVSGGQLPVSSWSAAMSECDVPTATVSAGSEPQYVAGGEVSLDTEPADVVAELLKACNGRLAEVGGIYKPHAGAPGTSVYSFSDDFLLSTEPQTFEPFQSLAQAVNAVTAKYIEPGEAWNQKDAPPLYSSALELEDDGRRQAVDVTYAFVFSGTQVQRLMKSARDEARRFRQHALPMPSDAFLLEPNDFVSWTSNRNGYSSKLFRVDAVQDLGNLGIGVNLTEVDPSDYDWIPSEDEKPIVVGPTVIVRVPAQVIVDWSASGVIISGDGGKVRAGIQLGWDADIDDVDGIQYEVRLHSDGTMIYQGETDRWDAGAILISQNILGLTVYDARGRYRPASARDTSWSGWLTVTTPDVAEGLSAQERYELSLVTADARGSYQELRDQLQDIIEQMALTAAQSGGDAYVQRQEIRDQVAAFSANLSAAVLHVTQAYIAGDAAIASDVVAVSAQAGLATAGGFYKLEATAAPAGVDARFAVYLNNGTVGSPDWKEAGFYLEVSGGVARATFDVDKFTIGNSLTNVTPFIVDGANVQMQNVKIKTSNDVVELDLENDRLLFLEPG